MRLVSPIGRALLAFSAAFAFHVNHAIAEPTSVYFKSPLDNQVVQSPVRLVFGLNGKRIGPVGDLNPDLGHHHLIINGDSIPRGLPVPFNAQHLHFGDGQPETELHLTPGYYRLTLQFASGDHQSYGVTLSKTIQIAIRKPLSLSSRRLCPGLPVALDHLVRGLQPPNAPHSQPITEFGFYPIGRGNPS
jgi:hypothetical protein